MDKKQFTRRDFFQSAALGSGGILLDPSQPSITPPVDRGSEIRLPREVWIAGFSMMGLSAPTPETQVTQVFRELKNVETFHPDILCLPETFPFAGVEKKTTLSEKLSISEKVLAQFSDYAKSLGCYLICPVYIAENGKTYNAAVLLDKKGNRIGDYKKIRVTDYEIEDGVTPGPLNPPVFKTDFGTIGIQICWDIVWEEGWKQLRKKGAEIIFWPSAFAGGRMINTAAWKNKTVVVSCTGKNTAKICDISGEVITQTGIWNRNIFCAPINLDKVFIPTWPFVEHFSTIQNRYGRKINITTFHEEEWTIFESLSPEVNLRNILDEYHIKTYEEYLANTDAVEAKARPA